MYSGASSKPLKIRIYGYKLASNTWSDSAIDLWTPNLSAGVGNTTPTITGTVLEYDANDLNANDDVISTKQNKPISLDVTANDTNYSGATLSYVQPNPAIGTVTNNGTVLTFSPATDYKGDTSFTYTLTKGTKTSTATVYVSVTELLPSLVVWNGALQTPKAVVSNSNIAGNDLTVVSNASSNLLGIYNNYFNILNFGTSNFDANKYIQVSVTPKLNYKITLSKFQFTYFAPDTDQAATKFQVRYSTDPNFADGGTILMGETDVIKGQDTTPNIPPFPEGVNVKSLYELKTFYIRIYPYGMSNTANNNNINFQIKNDYGGDIGPTVEGFVERSDNLIANPDTATTSSNTAINIPILANDENYSGLQSITVTQPANGTVVVNGTTDVTFTPNVGFSGTTTFQYTLFNGSAYSTATVTVNVTGEQIAIWTGTAWKDDVLPLVNRKVIFRGNYAASDLQSSELYAKEIEIEPNVNVLIGSDKTLIVQDKIVNKGILTFENNASLVQINDVQNTGNITYKRISDPMKNKDYTYWSSPVAGQTAKALSPNTYRTDYYHWKNGWIFWTGLMEIGKGYIIAVPRPGTYSNTEVAFASGAATYKQPVQFIGVPNNGTITAPTPLGGKEYLVGNPYPSAIDAEQFLEDNKNSIKGSVYLWNNSIPSVTGKTVNNSNDYIVYNATGSTKAQISVNSVNSSNNFKIAAGQSFFVQTLSTTTGAVTFNNTMRYDAPTAKSSKTTKNKSRLWLNLTNTQGAFKQLLVGYLAEASNDFEPRYDAETYNGNSFVNFYSIVQNKTLTIQGRSLPFNEADEIPLGYSSTIDGDFSIAIDETDGDLKNQNIFLEDKQTGVTYNLQKGNYTFTTAKGTFNDRFVLKYTTTTLGIGDVENTDNTLTIAVKNKIITIDAQNETIQKVMVYDLSGKMIYNNSHVQQSTLQIVTLQNVANQVVLVKVLLENGTMVTKKVIL